MNSQNDPDKREQPLCIAVVICNEIIEDKRTNNKSLISLFNSIGVQRLPAVHPRMFLMASLTNGTGAYVLTFKITGPSGLEIAKFEVEAMFSSPLGVVDYVVEIQNLQLNEEGTYFVDVMSGNHPLGHRRFNVNMLPH